MTATFGDTESAAYERDGVIRIRRFFDSKLITEIRGQIERYTREVLPLQEMPDCTLEADGSTIRNLWRLEQHSDYFRRLAGRQDIRQVVRKLVRGDPVLVGVETFNKPANVGSSVPYHQDNAYFCQSPPDVVTVWIAIDPVTVENGAVYYLKGSHRLGILPTKPSGTAGNSIGLAKPPEIPKPAQFCCTLSPGDLAIHHCLTIHHSESNRSDQSRLGLLLVYRGAHTRPDLALKETYMAAQGEEKPAQGST
jgi:ectoine hydroxylase-related dioxygenase (phytanoyl-CoA dioxygenase family)